MKRIVIVPFALVALIGALTIARVPGHALLSAQQPQTVIVDHTPLHVHMDDVMDRLRQTSPMSFAALFTPPYSRSRLVGLFLAVLELAKGGKVVPSQGETCGEIWVALGEA